MKGKLFFNILIVLFLVSASAWSATSGATETIKEVYTEVTAAGDRQKIIKILEKYSCFDCLASDILDEFCKNLSDEQCKSLKSTFIGLLKHSTADKLSQYKDNHTKYLDEEQKNGNTIVHTEVSSDGRTVTIDYQMKLISGKWLIVNYIVEDIDTVRNYRKQFKRLFAKQSFEKILNNLKNRLNNYK